jgi:hypothetical protein
MQRDAVRNLVAQQFNQSLAESGVQITAIPPAQLRALVEAMADSLFATIAALEAEDDAVLGATNQPVTQSLPTPEKPGTINPAGDTEEESLVWRGRPYLTIGTRYELTTQRLRIFRGVLGNQIDEIELIRVKDTRVKQHAGERMLNVGDISILSADASTPEFVLQNVSKPVEVRELIRKTIMNEKARRGLYYREDIGSEG